MIYKSFDLNRPKHWWSLRPTEDSSSSDDVEDTRGYNSNSYNVICVEVSDWPAQQESSCEVCSTAPRQGFALVPCGHARVCENCVQRVAELNAGCPVCRAQITTVMRFFQRRHCALKDTYSWHSLAFFFIFLDCVIALRLRKTDSHPARGRTMFI